jgi:hypothetical protein
MAKRRLPQDSVVVSIGEVRDLLRQDTVPPEAATTVARRELPVPLAVPAEVAAGVPSMDEVRASREARWQEDPAGPAPAIHIMSRKIRLLRLARFLAVGLLGVALAAGVAAWRWPTQRPLVLGGVAAEQALEAAGARHRLAQVEGELQAARARAKDLEAEKQGLATRVTELELAAKAQQKARARKAEPPAARKKTATRRSRKKARRPTRPKRRKPAKRTRQDKRIDDLLDGL